ncbi:tRNA uracil 4-sulfurtransferase ThiI [Spiroplasma endosymbiont of Amphibalanus improvisus]|uniref:tRNA uracil 4-sulfurtransferase ThiI n=1 Tax=Spiroplasma endosymbiont of Amphibalanus improvisus TaxID=3066327 RepID=UPI00313F0172
MTSELILIRFGELSTKKKNKINFINQLVNNLKTKLLPYKDSYEITKEYDRLFLKINDLKFEKQIIEIIKNTFGIFSFSYVFKINHSIDDLNKICTEITKDSKAKTFKLECRRNFKSFHLNSTEIKQTVAPFILNNVNIKVDVINPELTIFIEVRQNYIYIFKDKILTSAGLPSGSSGRGLVMLSGGIDSPVASYQMMKRGMSLDYVHFATPPHTNDKVIEKIKNLVSSLNRFSDKKKQKLYIVNFTFLQNEIMHIKNSDYRIIIMRRMFYRIAQILAKENNLSALITGEALGQVASQTIEALSVVDKLTDMPTFRPLIAMDKLEIINLAKKIKTYDISIEPFEDCCSLFVPEKPVTKPKLFKVEENEKSIELWEQILKQIIEKHVTVLEVE